MTDTQRPPIDKPVEEQQPLFNQDASMPLSQTSPEEVFLSPEPKPATAPETELIPVEKLPTSKGLVTRLGAGAAGLVLIATGAFAYLRATDSTGTSEQQSAEAIGPPPTTESAPVTDTTQSVGYTDFGNTLGTANLLPNEKHITATRPNGRTIEVPYLRDPETSSPQLAAESALALLGCYMTTGNQECLEPFSYNPTVLKRVNQLRTDVAKYYFDKGIDGLQVTFFSDTPVEFEQTGSSVYLSSSSNVIMNLTSSMEWQGQIKYEDPGLPYYAVEKAQFQFGKNSAGKMILADMSLAFGDPVQDPGTS